MKHILLITACALAACHIENKLEDIPDMSAGACEDLCQSISQSPVPSGCTRTCGPNIGLGVTVDGDTSAISLGTIPDGGTCDQVTDCPGITDDCRLGYLSCTQNGDSGCDAAYTDCLCARSCQQDLDQCNAEAESARQRCIARGFTDCDAIYDDTINNYCPCLYDLCLEDDDAPACHNPASACGKAQLVLPPAPAPTGPGTWTVHRTFLDYQLARSAQVSVETDAWPVANAAHHWVAVQLGAVTPHDALYLLGLRSGDQLISLNGIAVVSGIANPAPLLALRNAGTLTLVLRRSGAMRTFSYHVIP